MGYARVLLMSQGTTFQGEELTNNGEKYEMVLYESQPKVQSKLIIKKTGEDNFGT